MILYDNLFKSGNLTGCCGKTASCYGGGRMVWAVAEGGVLYETYEEDEEE